MHLHDRYGCDDAQDDDAVGGREGHRGRHELLSGGEARGHADEEDEEERILGEHEAVLEKELEGVKAPKSKWQSAATRGVKLPRELVAVRSERLEDAAQAAGEREGAAEGVA